MNTTTTDIGMQRDGADRSRGRDLRTRRTGRRRARRLATLVGVAALAASACGGDEPADAGAATTASIADPTSATTEPATPVPATTVPATPVPATTVPATTMPVTTTSSTDDASASTVTSPPDDGIVLEMAPVPISLRAGEVTRFETAEGAVEFVGQDGWGMFTTPNNVWITPLGGMGQTWVSIARFSDDPSGLSVATDPFMTQQQMDAPDDTTFLPLPADWFGHVGSLPGVNLGDVTATTVGGLEGEGATYSVTDVPDAPGSICFDGVMSWSDRAGGSWCFVEGESGTLTVVEIDGARYEFNIGATEAASEADRVARDALVASLRFV